MMDGMMSEEIRIGVLIRSEMNRAGYWRRKNGDIMSMSFSSTLLDIAGGIVKLIQEWEPVKP